MSPEQQMVIAERVFKAGGDLVLPGWLLLLFAPGWKWTQRFCTAFAPLLIAIAYGLLLGMGPRVPGAGFGSVQAVGLLFSQPMALTAGWLHYLAFDLFTGAWEARDAVRLGISRWLVAPCLVLTFLLGPLGLALYLVLRAVLRRRIGVLAAEEEPA